MLTVWDGISYKHKLMISEEKVYFSRYCKIYLCFTPPPKKNPLDKSTAEWKNAYGYSMKFTILK